MCYDTVRSLHRKAGQLAPAPYLEAGREVGEVGHLVVESRNAGTREHEEHSQSY